MKTKSFLQGGNNMTVITRCSKYCHSDTACIQQNVADYNCKRCRALATTLLPRLHAFNFFRSYCYCCAAWDTEVLLSKAFRAILMYYLCMHCKCGFSKKKYPFQRPSFPLLLHLGLHSFNQCDKRIFLYSLAGLALMSVADCNTLKKSGVRMQ